MRKRDTIQELVVSQWRFGASDTDKDILKRRSLPFQQWPWYTLNMSVAWTKKTTSPSYRTCKNFYLLALYLNSAFTAMSLIKYLKSVALLPRRMTDIYLHPTLETKCQKLQKTQLQIVSWIKCHMPMCIKVNTKTSKSRGNKQAGGPHSFSTPPTGTLLQDLVTLEHVYFLQQR